MNEYDHFFDNLASEFAPPGSTTVPKQKILIENSLVRTEFKREFSTDPDDISHEELLCTAHNDLLYNEEREEMNTDMTKICLVKDEIWGMNIGGRIFRSMENKFSGLVWSYFKVADNMRFLDFEVTEKGHIFGISASDHQLYRIKNPISKHTPQVYHHEDDPLTKSFNGHVFEPAFDGDMQKIKCITAASHNLLYALDEVGDVIYIDTSRRWSLGRRIAGWRRLCLQPSCFKKITVMHEKRKALIKNNELWGLTVSGEPQRYNWNTGEWRGYPGTQLTDICVSYDGSDNVVYGIRKTDGCLMKVKWNPTQLIPDKFESCKQTHGMHKLLAIGSNNKGLYGVDKQDGTRLFKLL
ncbi:RHPN2 [Acrasis kona]|uniref:RHPN2 n=1 Tax=Acrasis kona TaxID=1008807 RepID=A0AAW2ZED5_9EUKA